MVNFKSILPAVCHRCGACVAVCPTGVLKVDAGRITEIDGCSNCGLCYNYCPGREFLYPEANQNVFGLSSLKEEAGNYQVIYVAQSVDDKIRDNASGGGVGTGLGLMMLREKMVQAVTIVSTDSHNPRRSIARLAMTEEDILKGSQSKYMTVPLLASLKALDEKITDVAVIGLPCHVHGVRRLQDSSWRDRHKIRFTIGLFCGFNLEPEATDYLIARTGLNPEDVISVQYRGGTWPGGFLVRDKNGRERFIEKFYYNYVNMMFVPDRCLVCPDLTSEFADISLGDAWERGKSNGGWTTVIVRTPAGKDLLAQAQAKGYLRVEESSIGELRRGHAHLLHYKKKGFFIRQKFSGIKPVFNLTIPYMTDREKLFHLGFYLAIRILKKRFARNLLGLLPVSFLGNLAKRGRGVYNSMARRKTAGRTGRFTLDEMKDHWDHMSEEGYDEFNVKMDSYLRRFEEGLKQAEIPEGSFILDAGCGTGKGMVYLNTKMKVRGVGADVSGKMLNLARQRLKETNGSFDLLQADIETLPLRDCMFDYIVSFEVLEHTPDPGRFLRELFRVLKPGGGLLLTTPNPRWELAHRLAAVTGLHHSEGPHRFLSIKEIKGHLKDAGFCLHSVKTSVLIPCGPAPVLKFGRKLEDLLGDRFTSIWGLRRIVVCHKAER